jgi:hypothetical protein
MPTAGVTRGARVLLAVVLLLSYGVGVAVWLSPSFRTELKHSLLRQPDDVTELYFDPTTPLPELLVPGTEVELRYVIVNRSDHSRHYHVTVTRSDGPATEDDLTLPAQQSVTRPIALLPVKPATRYTVTVTLSPTLSIDFSAETTA